ncbi:MAG: hypothetical protein ABSF78_03270 [Candidatus Acidiferrales bacterium]|jgi:hypothetical protein
MTDWRQIQARIRKAKNSPDALVKLSELFQRTRDGMVAWELGAVEEKAERMSEAIKWYTVAAERFRRSEWKKKAEEALIRLGAPIPAAKAEPAADPADTHEESSLSTSEFASESTSKNIEKETPLPLAYGEIPEDASNGSASPEATAQSATTAAALGDPARKKRRRGRRGGRGRRRKDGAAAPSLPTKAYAESVEAQPVTPETSKPLPFRQPEPRPAAYERPARVERHVPEPVRSVPVEVGPPQLPSERTAHGRAGDPALASRMAQLDSMLRRLVSSPLHRLDEADQAPAGPGVFLLSDSDQISSYYIEACQTLRVGLGNLARGSRGSKNPRVSRGFSDAGFKERLAEHLGIHESKVSQYMKDHCVVRWIQLDDDAQHLAHFAIGVLRTPLNLD